MKASEARDIASKNKNTEYARATQWIKNAAERGEFSVVLDSTEFQNLSLLHDKFVLDGFRCYLYGTRVTSLDAVRCLSITW